MVGRRPSAVGNGVLERRRPLKGPDRPSIAQRVFVRNYRNLGTDTLLVETERVSRPIAHMNIEERFDPSYWKQCWENGFNQWGRFKTGSPTAP